MSNDDAMRHHTSSRFNFSALVFLCFLACSCSLAFTSVWEFGKWCQLHHKYFARAYVLCFLSIFLSCIHILMF